MTPLSVKIGGDASQFRRELKSVKSSAASLGTSLKSSLGGVGGAIGAGLSVGGAVSGMVSAAKEAKNFEQQMAMVSTMLDASTMSYMPKFASAIEDMSVRFGESTATLAKGLYDVLSSGIGAADAIGALEVASRAAIGGITDTATAVDGMTTIMNAYQMSAFEAGLVSDLMFNTVKEGKITFAQLAANISKLAPTAKAAGLGLRDMFAAVATAVKVEKPERAMTAITAAMRASAKEGKSLLRVLDEMQGKSLEDVLAAGYADEAANGIFLLAGNYQLFLDQLGKTKQVAGLSEEALGKMMDTTDRRIKQLEQSWNRMKRSIASVAVSGGTKGYLDELAQELDAIAKFGIWDTMKDNMRRSLDMRELLGLPGDTNATHGAAPTEKERQAFIDQSPIAQEIAQEELKRQRREDEKAAAERAKADKDAAAMKKALGVFDEAPEFEDDKAIERLKEMEHAIQLQELKNKGLEREAEILDEIYRFEKRNGKLSDEDRKALEERAGKLYDLKKPIEEMDMTETPEWRKERAAGATSLERIGAILGGGVMTSDMTIQKAMKSLSEKQLKVQEKILEKTGNNLTLTEA